ncbi:cobalamin biosynthesis protein CbiD [Cetobacterium sp. 2A]|uniref:cobalt-precorrin-5B (C(1))-methyltransferase CbiD n=1 Tax=Cetobacterium sp. 2A TaxID=2754723 RepID=UPI00163C982A|nr:cobalt-precorrin-5B (C(1))-methyltransferase CbiD [Cetobacterium sp. 2A]MBC2855107.1 cobalamin biosynthesis protein CbiD [Cetobacterium sp. 2A]
MKKQLKSGYTTGTCAAAATTAALELLISNRKREIIEIKSLNGIDLKVPIHSLKLGKEWARGVVLKNSGDDPDVTNGIEICVKVKLYKELPQIEKAHYFDNIAIVGGRGVGLVTKKGLQVPAGKSAINPGPQKMIRDAVQEIIKGTDKKVLVKVYIPQGKAKALKTFNPRLGITGGISVLGSTGIVKPMSEEAWKDSLYVELKVLKENTARDWVIFAFGNHGKAFCESMGVDTTQMVVVSNYIGFMIDSAMEIGFKRVLLIGHIGKAIKIAGGIFNTHSRVADGRLEILSANAVLVDEPRENILKILESNTVEEACQYVEKNELFRLIANKVASKSVEYSRGEIEFQSALFTFSGNLIGESDDFKKLAGDLVEK